MDKWDIKNKETINNIKKCIETLKNLIKEGDSNGFYKLHGDVKPYLPNNGGD